MVDTIPPLIHDAHVVERLTVPPKKIAHRGFSGSYPENTIIAFNKAIECGVDGIETDLRLSSDGKWLIFHDYNLCRSTDNLEQAWFSTKTHQELTEFIPNIMTLEEFLELINGQVFVYLDIKGHPTYKQLQNLLDILIQSTLIGGWIIEQFYLASFNYQTIKYLTSMKNIKPAYFGFKLGYIGYLSPPLQKDFGYQLDFVSTEADLVTQEYVDYIHNLPSNKLKVFVYVLNDHSSLYFFNSMGVDGLLTDHPDLFEHLTIFSELQKNTI